MMSSGSISGALKEIKRIEIENDVGKASTIVACLILVILFLASYVFEATLSNGIRITNTISLESLSLVMVFFLIDMTLAYHFVQDS